MADLSPGFGVLTTPKEKKTDQFGDSTEAGEHACMMDLESFLRWASDPKDLSRTIEAKGLELLDEWRKINRDSADSGNLMPVYFNKEICRYTWVTRRGETHTSIVEWIASSYNFTTKQLDASCSPKISLDDLKVPDEISAAPVSI
jgi:hypothetical protein